MCAEVPRPPQVVQGLFEKRFSAATTGGSFRSAREATRSTNIGERCLRTVAPPLALIQDTGYARCCRGSSCSAHCRASFGRNFDAAFRLWTGGATYTLTEKLSAEYELQRLKLDPDPNDESTWIHVIRANQFFTPDLFLRVFFQTNSAIDRRNVQAVFVYRYLPPFGTVQVAYQRGTAEFGERSNQGNTLFVKITTVL